VSRLATSFVLGYHGCDKDIATRAISGEIDLLHSDKAYDWLGPGAYFWESDPVRALEWARERHRRGLLSEAAVVGAVIDLRNCLDLIGREGLEQLRSAHASFLKMREDADLPIPENRPLKGRKASDRHLRYLDCAVIRHLHSIIESQPDEAVDRIEPYDTVRGMFTEGKRLYSGSGLFMQSHVQIAVRRNACILGLFHPRPDIAGAVAK
jgi:hypothetical protein